MDTAKANVLAGILLSPLGNRWAHVQAVAAQGRSIANAGISGVDNEILVTACWLHDIGYAQALKTTGFHPLDGAVFLAGLGVDERIVSLVAYHSGAMYEAEERGLSDALAAFAPADPVLLDALTYADLTTGPKGQRVTFPERISEILGRYGAGDPVHQAITRAQPSLASSVKRTENLIAEALSTIA
jgi:putative nucleotidyltransferase with HDIG domain